ncbi:MAG: hypothetical protein Q4D85_01570 [Corynebacterium sp.]|uniref:hypothetical protein n=1 Tax=Corynebacterium sp. TaxID=1720 RepID=UPI0026DA97F0|nr:hypothetical protein [Corynebacterium sp.]MDO5097417.1 hypothetical protein [Corynebacterium sp.]
MDLSLIIDSLKNFKKFVEAFTGIFEFLPKFIRDSGEFFANGSAFWQDTTKMDGTNPNAFDGKPTPGLENPQSAGSSSSSSK